MPESVAARLEADPSVTRCDAWRPLVPNADPTGTGLLGQLSGGVTTRSTYTEEAVLMAAVATTKRYRDLNLASTF